MCVVCGGYVGVICGDVCVFGVVCWLIVGYMYDDLMG